MKTVLIVVMELEKQWRNLLSEFVATMLLVFFGCMSCIPIEGMTAAAALHGALGFGLAAAFCIQIFGHISGALMNPALTLTAVIFGRISPLLGVAYSIAECAGAIAGYGLVLLVGPPNSAANGICVTAPNVSVSPLQAMGLEAIMMFALSLILCAVLDPVTAQHKDSLPLRFGFSISALAIAGAHWSGGGLNPARALGPAVWANRWDAHWIYWVGPLIGSVLSTVLYKYIWLKEIDPKIPN